MPWTAVDLRRRFLRACELKQSVNWGKIVKCLQQWALVMNIDAPAVVRIERVEQLKETACRAKYTPNLWSATSLLSMRGYGIASFLVRQAGLVNEGAAARHATTALRVWAMSDVRSAMNRLSLHSVNASQLGEGGELNLVELCRIAIAAAIRGILTESFEKWYPLLEAFEAGAFYIFITDRGIEVCTLPSVVKVDDQGRLHSASGPAFVWLNDIRDYYWHDVYVESYVVEQPERISLTDLEMENSPNVRQAKIDRFCEVRSSLDLPPVSSVTAEELKERYIRACGLKQTVNWGKIVECFQHWAEAVKIETPAIVRVERAEQLKATEIFFGDTELSRLLRGSRASEVALDAKIAREAALEQNTNATNPTHVAFLSWYTRNHHPMGKFWTQQTLSWMCPKAIGALELGISTEFLIWYPLFEAFEAGAFCYHITDRGIEICTLPTVVKVDDRNRLHSESGPAFAWLDDIQDYYWHGVRVEQYVVDNPERITVAEIEAEANVEVRRIKIERFGQTRYLLDSSAREIHRDDYGTLYRKEERGDEPLVMVNVVNATPEPDGSFKDYFLRVPPTMRTAREAVAWTFGKTAEVYEPEKET
jgi:hypothetical protein